MVVSSVGLIDSIFTLWSCFHINLSGVTIKFNAHPICIGHWRIPCFRTFLGMPKSVFFLSIWSQKFRTFLYKVSCNCCQHTFHRTLFYSYYKYILAVIAAVIALSLNSAL